MKIIHTSDLHLDSPLTSRLSAAEARLRSRELVSSFRRIIDYGMRERAAAIIIAGDLFDNDKVKRSTLDSIVGLIESAKPIYFFYLPGNHEKDRLRESGISLPENLKLFSEDWTYFRLGEIIIAGRSEISDGAFDTLELNGESVNLVVMHGAVAERTSAPDKIGMKDAAALPIDYLALGHYHSYAEHKISDRCTAVYSGTPEGRGFDEVGEKGFVVIDINGGVVEHRFIKGCERTLHAVKVPLDGAARDIEIEGRIAHEVFGISKNDLVRIVLTGEREPMLHFDADALAQRFKNSFFYFEIKDESRLRICADDYKNDKSFKGEFIRMVLAAEGLSEKERLSIIECGIRALAGEEI